MIIQALAIQQAITTKHNALANIMRNNQTLTSSFRGEVPEEAVAKETILEVENMKSALAFKMAEAQEEEAKKELEEENKKLSIVA